MIASRRDPICIVCPHPSSQHVYREDNMWCRTCNADEMAGPCSAYFMSQHAYMPPPPQPQACRICGLSADNRSAHPVTTT